MKQLSGARSPLPSLVLRASDLSPELVATLDRSNVAHPTSKIADSFWTLIEQLDDMLISLDFGSLDGKSQAHRKRSILSGTELLMHRCAALNDYLGVLARTLLTSTSAQKKSQEAQSAKRRLDDQINRLFKMPINFIKHDGFCLSWIEMSLGDLVTHGYMVAGPIGDGVQGPIKFRRSGRDDPEGYSFALTLREVLPAFYLMCATVEDVLGRAGVLPTAGNEKQPATRDARSVLLSETLELLNHLPFRGFPDEHRVRVSVFSLQDGAVVARTSPLRKLPGTFRVRSEIRSVRGGSSYRLPYWSGGDSAP